MWSLGEEERRPLIKEAIEAGFNFFDTANMYSQGSSERRLKCRLSGTWQQEIAAHAVAIRAGWKAGEIRSKMFRHTHCAGRLQTLD